MVTEGGGARGDFTRLDSEGDSQASKEVEHRCRWLLLLAPVVSAGDSGSGPTEVSHRR